MERFDEVEIKVLRVTEEWHPPRFLPDEPVDVVLPCIPQSDDYPVKGLKGLREQFDMLLGAMKMAGLMETGHEEAE